MVFLSFSYNAAQRAVGLVNAYPSSLPPLTLKEKGLVAAMALRYPSDPKYAPSSFFGELFGGHQFKTHQ